MCWNEHLVPSRDHPPMEYDEDARGATGGGRGGRGGDGGDGGSGEEAVRRGPPRPTGSTLGDHLDDGAWRSLGMPPPFCLVRVPSWCSAAARQLSLGRSAGCSVAPRSQEEGSGDSERDYGRLSYRQPAPKPPICQLSTARPPPRGAVEHVHRAADLIEFFLEFIQQELSDQPTPTSAAAPDSANAQARA